MFCWRFTCRTSHDNLQANSNMCVYKTDRRKSQEIWTASCKAVESNSFKNAMTPSGPSWAMRCKTGVVWFCAYVILIIEHLDQWRRMDVDHPYEILQHLGPCSRFGRNLMMHHGGCAGELPDCRWRRKATSSMKSLGVRIANTSCQQLVTQPLLITTWRISQFGGYVLILPKSNNTCSDMQCIYYI